MHIQGPVEEAILKQRENRFVAIVNQGGNDIRCHLPNPGRMKELFIPGKKVFIIRSTSNHRRTSASIVGIDIDGEIIQLHTLTGNKLLTSLNKLETFSNYRLLNTEISIGDHRFDGLFDVNGIRTIVEVKSTTRVVNDIACFPDAISKRAVDHMLHLAKLPDPTLVIFMVFRKAKAFQPCRDIDTRFSEVFDALRKDIRFVALQCHSEIIEKVKQHYILTKISQILPIKS